MEREAVVRHPLFFLRPHRPSSWSPIRDYTQRRYTQQKEPENNLKLLFCVLPWKDSNSHRRNQNPTCYHYTTRQFFSLSSTPAVIAMTISFLTLQR